MSLNTAGFGPMLREWRQRRRVSQLDLALDGNISTRHLSFLETGRARPSREMVLNLAEQLSVPLRERNVLLTAAGFAPAFPERKLDDPTLEAARGAVDAILRGHEPFPALAVDRHWTLVSANGAMTPLLAGVDPALLAPPVNVMRVALHPAGISPRIVNLPEWRAHLLERLQHQIEASADPQLISLVEELRGYPAPRAPGPPRPVPSANGVFVPLVLATEAGVLRFFSTVTVFGTPIDVTLSELALECFFPADAATADILKRRG